MARESCRNDAALNDANRGALTQSRVARAIVIGAGQIGAAIANRLAGDGWSVTLVTRGQRAMPSDLAPGLEPLVADHGDAASIAPILADGADALIDTIAYDRADANRMLALQSGLGAIVAISSVGVYADHAGRSLGTDGAFPAMPVPITEQQATVPPGVDSYAARKRAMELALLDDAQVPVTIIRPCAVHGPESRDPREWWFVKRLFDRRTRIPVAYRGASQFQTSATVNIAGVVAAALAVPGTRVLNAVDPDQPTISEIGSAIMAAVGRDAELVAMPGAPIGSVGYTPWSVALPFVCSDAAARAIGYVRAVDYASGVVAACRWLSDAVPRDDWASILTGLAKYPYDLFDYAAEDRWLATA